MPTVVGTRDMLLRKKHLQQGLVVLLCVLLCHVQRPDTIIVVALFRSNKAMQSPLLMPQ